MNWYIFLTIWAWLLQITVWISLYILLLYVYYVIRFAIIKSKYPSELDENLVPLYTNTWSENKLDPYFRPSLITFLISYILYIVTQYFTPTLKFLKLDINDIKLDELLQKFFTSKPDIKLDCSCYHFKGSSYSYIDAQGVRQTSYNIYRENSHFDHFNVPYYSVRDVSGPFILNSNMNELNHKDFIQLEIPSEIIWADSISFADYEKYKSDIIEKNKDKDLYMEFTEKRTISAFNDNNYFIKLRDNTSKFISRFWYYLFTYLALAQYYKWYINYKCISQKFRIIKLISTRYNLLEKNEYEGMQPKIDLINNHIDFNINDTAFCFNEEIEEPSPEENQEAINKYRLKLPRFEKVNENGNSYFRNLNEQKYIKILNFSK